MAKSKNGVTALVNKQNQLNTEAALAQDQVKYHESQATVQKGLAQLSAKQADAVAQALDILTKAGVEEF